MCVQIRWLCCGKHASLLMVLSDCDDGGDNGLDQFRCTPVLGFAIVCASHDLNCVCCIVI